VKIEGATAVYDGKWWVVEVPGYGATQCKSIAQARRMACALVGDLEDVPATQIEVDLSVVVPHLTGQLQRVRRAQQAAQSAVEAEAAARRTLVHELQTRGLSQHDIAAVAGVSRPAVQKLLRKKVSV
jgi:DNA-directed RNA polymerase specialized sigma24 family protein